MVGKLTPDQLLAFVRELTELTQKHGIVIGGCGCCGSPYLQPLEQAEESCAYLPLDNPSFRYEVSSDGDGLSWDPEKRWIKGELAVHSEVA